MNYFKNKGMYIEELINNTASYYDVNSICYIEKRFLPIIPTSIKNNLVIGKLIKKSSVDYCCLYKKNYIDFEVKQTDLEFFDLRIIKEHQMKHLKKINKLGGSSFLLIHFFKFDRCLMLGWNKIDFLLKNKKFKVYHCDEFFNEDTLNIIFPGIIDFVSFFEKKLFNT